MVNSVKERVVLGPEERAMVRTLNSAYSVIEVWRRLIASADFKVLRGERRALRGREKYLEADRLFLRWEQEGDKRDGPAYLIVKVYEAGLHTFPFSLLDPLALLPRILSNQCFLFLYTLLTSAPLVDSPQTIANS